jgi:hypothetical protein
MTGLSNLVRELSTRSEAFRTRVRHEGNIPGRRVDKNVTFTDAAADSVATRSSVDKRPDWV